jgi:pyruvate/2-oxoglutarate/acetoin dehydrogenase E1 component
VVFFEHKRLYKNKMHVPNGSYSIPFGVAEIKRSGGDVTIVATGAMVQESVNAAKRLREENGIHAEVIDTRTLVPLDKKTILDSVRKTGRLVVVDEDYERCGIASEISAMVADEGFGFLKASIKRVVTPTIPIPFNANLERALIPDEAKIIAAVRQIEKAK